MEIGLIELAVRVFECQPLNYVIAFYNYATFEQGSRSRIVHSTDICTHRALFRVQAARAQAARVQAAAPTRKQPTRSQAPPRPPASNPPTRTQSGPGTTPAPGPTRKRSTLP